MMHRIVSIGILGVTGLFAVQAQAAKEAVRVLEPVKTMEPVKQAEPGAVGSHVINWSGFLDLTYVLSDGREDPDLLASGGSERRFDANGELDLDIPLMNKMATRFDLDFYPTTASGDSSSLEQAFFSWESAQHVIFKGGVFNNPLGWEAEDAPQLFQITHGQLYDLWNDTTAQYGNNVIGVAVTGNLGQVSLTGAFLNDLGDVEEKNSFMGVVNVQAAPGMELEVGFVTQDEGLETLVDMNGTFTSGLFTVGAEMLVAGEGVDMGLGVTGVFKFSDQVSGTLRFDNVSYENDNLDDTRSVTLAVGYLFDKHLMGNAEIRMNSDDSEAIIGDGDLIQLEMVATF